MVGLGIATSSDGVMNFTVRSGVVIGWRILNARIRLVDGMIFARWGLDQPCARVCVAAVWSRLSWYYYNVAETLPEEEISTSRRVYSSDGVNKSTHYLTAFVSGYRPLNGIRHGAYSIKLSSHSNSSTKLGRLLLHYNV